MHFKEIIAFLFDQFSILTATERSAGRSDHVSLAATTCSKNYSSLLKAIVKGKHHNTAIRVLALKPI